MIKKFYVVLIYELKELFTNKAFLIVTVLLSLGGIIVLSLPRVFPGIGNSISGEETQLITGQSSNSEKILALYDETGSFDQSLATPYFPNVTWQIATSAKEVSDLIESQKVQAGFVVLSIQDYDYYVYDREMYDNTTSVFHSVMIDFYREEYCKAHGMSFEDIAPLFTDSITSHEQVLHSDTRNNYFYCYILIILVFMLIVIYGQMIAVSVTSEKSNRAIEVLVTSAPPSSLLFGKVLAQAIGGLVQMLLIIGSTLITYQLNRGNWGGMLDIVLQIPGSVLLSFALFGLGGYLFYAFLYGAMGALVSKTEDISKSSSGLMIIIMFVYIFSLMQLNNVDGIVIKVLSFLPFSSYGTMFMRIAMKSVAPWEVVLSFAILVASIIGAGIIGAKIYRLGTLRYGNPIKISTAIKSLRQSE
jgi:ABC-2 type transport system permease protein